MERIGLLDDVRDKVTGFEGRVLGIIHWAYTTPTLIVQGRDPDVGPAVGEQWLDEARCDVVKRHETLVEN